MSMPARSCVAGMSIAPPRLGQTSTATIPDRGAQRASVRWSESRRLRDRSLRENGRQVLGKPRRGRRRLDEPLDDLSCAVDAQAREDAVEHALEIDTDGVARRYGQVPHRALERSERLLARLVVEL